MSYLQEKNVNNFAKAISTVINSYGYDHVDVCGVTNYLDMRFMFLINKLKAEKKELSSEHMKLLEESMDLFLSSLNADNTYDFGNTGRYELKLDINILRTIANKLLE